MRVRSMVVASLALAGMVALVAAAEEPLLPLTMLPALDFALPGHQMASTVPAQTAPDLPTATVQVPDVTSPDPCRVSVCNDGLVLPDLNLQTPSTEGESLSSPALDLAAGCTPGNLACHGALHVPEQHVLALPPVEAQSLHVPGAELPGLCGTLDAECPGPETIIHRQTILVTPNPGETPLTPDIGVSLRVPATSVALRPADPETGETEPISVVVPAPVVGDIPLTVCSDGCPMLQAPALPFQVAHDGDLVLGLEVGPDAHEVAVPSQLDLPEL